MITSKIVNLCENKDKALHELTIDEIKSIDKKLNEDVLKLFNLENSIKSKKSYGGTSFENIKKMIKKYKKMFKKILLILFCSIILLSCGKKVIQSTKLKKTIKNCQNNLMNFRKNKLLLKKLIV